MKTYVITLERSKERSEYIKKHLQEHQLEHQIINAVDGSLLSPGEIAAACDMETVNRLDWWLTKGAIGCALSHYKVYKTFLESDDELAFILEDDVVLPSNIKEILADIEKEIKDDEIISLYYTSFEQGKLSKVGSTKLSEGSLLYPLDVTNTMAATAYLMRRKTAQKMMDVIKPIRVTADCWHHFHKEKAFNSFRVHYPSIVSIKNFKSSIDYLDSKSLKGKLSKFINNKKIPFLYQYTVFKRKKRLEKMLNYTLVNECSPMCKEDKVR